MMGMIVMVLMTGFYADDGVVDDAGDDVILH